MARSAIVGLLAVLGLGMGACSTTNVQKMAPVQDRLAQAPVTYASADTVRMSPVVPEWSAPAPVTPRFAPVVRPQTQVSVEAPVASLPRPPMPIVPENVSSSLVDFDRIDRELYAHQRVGKKYRVFGKSYTPRHQPDYDVTGTASWYGPNFDGKPTASGEIFDMEAMTAAHKTLPLHSLVEVTNVTTGQRLILRINDRGPFVGDRIIDLSKAAARELGLLESGLKEVRVRYAGPADPNDIGDTPQWPRERDMDRVAEAAPVTPRAEAPAAPQGYTPLRDMGESRLPETVAAPDLGGLSELPFMSQSERPLPVPQPFTAVPEAAPQFEERPHVRPEPTDEDGLTLTIKGPIHLASALGMPNPEFVRNARHD